MENIEVTLQNKFTKFTTIKNVDGEYIRVNLTSDKPLTLEKALDYFKVNNIKALVDFNNAMYKAVANTAHVVAEEYFKQLGMNDVLEERDETYYEYQEELRKAMLETLDNFMNS